MTETDEFPADTAELEAATGAVVLARRRLRAARRARLLGRVGRADVVQAKLALAAARAELAACRGGAGWWVRRPRRRRHRVSARRDETAAPLLRSAATTTVTRVVIVAYVASAALVLLVAQWPMRGPRLLLGPGGHAAHAGDLLLLTAALAAAIAVLRLRS